MKFNIVIAVWGEAYVDSLSDVTLPSLRMTVAEREMVLRNEWEVTVVSRPGDCARLAEIIAKDLDFCRPIFIDIDPETFANSYTAMAAAHHRGAQQSIKAGAFGIILPPDVALSGGSLMHIVSLAEAGKKVVMTVGPRIRSSTASNELRTRLAGGRTISSRDLARLGRDHLHPEWDRYFWTSNEFSSRPFVLYWNAPGGWLSRNFHLHPIMIDFSEASALDALSRDTIDGEFIYHAFSHDLDAVHVIQDSDDLLVLSLTPDDVFYSEHQEKAADLESIRRVAFDDIVNPLHRRFARQAVKIHWDGLDERWLAIEAETGRIIDEALARDPCADSSLAMTAFSKVPATATPYRVRPPRGMGVFSKMRRLLKFLRRSRGL